MASQESGERDNNIGLKDVSYKSVKLSPSVEKFSIPKYEEIYKPSMPHHPFYTHYDKNFSVERFLYPAPPVHIGEYKIDYDPQEVTNVLRCPIKVAKSRDIYLPKELAFLKEYVEFCCIYETSFNDRFEDLYAHITVDYKDIKKGESHRVPGWHVDGFQGSKFPEKHEIEHSYLWTNTFGTEFCVQPFFVEHIDSSKYLVFDEFNKQAKECNIVKPLDSNVYIFDPYMVHRSPIINENVSRLLVRVTFECQKLLDPNDTVNPALEFDVPHKYDIRNRLGEYKYPVPEEMYGYRLG